MTSEGQVLHGRYRVISQLGSGGMGSVWLAEDRLLERRLALKELAPYAHTTNPAESRARALVEARAMARVKHRAIVRIHDIFFAGDDPWIVMEYIRGRSLAEMIHDELLKERTIAAIGLSVVQGLQAVHSARIVHRDVKPANILADADGSVFLVDFGIAKIAGDVSLTGQSKIVGTTEFIAPERLLGKSAQPPSDLWSLGVTLYHALEGHSPFAGRSGDQSLQALITAILHDRPTRPVNEGPLADILLRLLSKNPTRRPDATEVIGGLEAILGAKPLPSGTPLTPTKPLSSDPRATDRRRETAGNNGKPARGLRRDGERFDDRELVRREMANAIRVTNRPDSDSGVEVLLGKPDVENAQILAGCSLDVAAELMQGIAAKQPRKAGTILQILSVSRSGKILDYLPPGVAASIVTTMPVDDAVQILSRSDARTVADVVMDLPSHGSGRLIEAMPRARAVAVLSHVRPASAAAVLGAITSELSSKLLTGLGPDFRALVLPHM
jgi:serine/threonine protein kinase